MIDLMTKIEFFLFFMSTLNIIKHVWAIVDELRSDEPKKIEYTKIETFVLGLSISYILTTIFI